MRDFSDSLAGLRKRLDEAAGYLKVADLRARQPQLEAEASRPDLWDDQDAARRVTGELSAINDDLGLYDDLAERISDAETLFELAREEQDESVIEEIGASIAALDDGLRQVELRSLFAGDYDERDAVCEIHSGEGGTDAQDWAEMLLRMFMRWSENRGFGVDLVSVTEGNEAGISSVQFLVTGRHAYGLLQSENGVHRLVRISPFNAQGKRQTAFASFLAVPSFDEDDDEISVDDSDLRIDTYRSSGAGGQHVNVTDSAVRITHIPTGIVTSCQNERSQHQNKERAMQMLKARLADLRRQEREAEIEGIRGDTKRVGFGSQIRSYVLHPYQQVKDLRTDHEVSQVDDVLDGELDGFMEAYLRWQREQAAAT